MAESVMTYLVNEAGLADKFVIASAAAHTDEIGNQPHRGTREKLAREGIPLVPHRARLLTRADGEKFDYLIGMDVWNVRDMKKILGEEYAHKVSMLLDFTARPGAIADPWYTGNFDETFADVMEGCTALLNTIAKREGWSK